MTSHPIDVVTAPVPDSPKSPELLEHEARLASGDREYMEAFIKSSAKKGHIFSVTLMCEDPFLSQQLYESVKKDSKVLIAGCKVTTIFGGDVGALHMHVKGTLKQLVAVLGG